MAPRRFDPERVRALRRAADATQSDMAEGLGVSPAAVASWESGRSVPDGEALPAVARFLKQDLDDLFPRDGLPDLTDLRCDAGFSQYETKDLLGTKSAGPVANAERGKRRLGDKFVAPLAKGYRVTVDDLLAAQERSFGNDAREPDSKSVDLPQAPQTLADKFAHQLSLSYPGEQEVPSDSEIARRVNEYAGGPIVTANDITNLRTGVAQETTPLVCEGLGAFFGVSPAYFKTGDAVARQIVDGLRLLGDAPEGGIGRVQARGMGPEGLSDDVLAFIQEVAAELKERGLPAPKGDKQ
ncbi:helix-turn-helix transcriptional regulator [Streptomyces sp. NPDC051561]|uniref:helix-turn-helix transcriptional regulator n=1 Tax=Streptomyces sp. NPDC051561 TaxID=3365658 RepID=UPI00379FE783